ncbi:phosphatidate cytidylyltransferase [Rubrivirga sp. IMCC45206]|uniref:phosphatidate cytidylyltransferase n=1 Tax=Rubrivirga sp. IMCC45206 TaxID=3391614 RepID=UPI00398FAE74
MSNFTQRILTGLVGATLVVAAMWAGGWWFGALMTAVALAAQFELYKMLQAGGAAPVVGLGLVLGLAAVVWPLAPVTLLVLVAGVPMIQVAVLFKRRNSPLLDAAATVFGVVYPALLASSIVLLRVGDIGLRGDEAFWLTAAVLFAVWSADSFAYLAGRAFGKTPLFERISPKKTWEGAIGGAVGAFAMVAAFKLGALGDAVSWLDVAMIALASGVLGPLGDLSESQFKRSVGVKDSASWLPGHGGLLDRVDATLVAVPVVVLYFHLTRGLL